MKEVTPEKVKITTEYITLVMIILLNMISSLQKLFIIILLQIINVSLMEQYVLKEVENFIRVF